MESLTSTGGGQAPTILSTGGSNDGLGGGGALGLLGLAALFGGNGFGNRNGSGTCEPPASFAYAQRAADNSSELLASLGKSEGDIKEAFNAGLHRNQIENAAHFSNLNNRLCDTEKEAIKAGYEARLESLQTKSDLLANQNANTISIKDDIKDFRFSVDKDFCRLNSDLDKRFHHIEHFVEKKFDALLERDYKARISQLEEKLELFRYRETQQDLSSIKRDTSRAICALGKVPNPTGQVSNILEGCGC